MTNNEQKNISILANIRHELRTPVNAIIGYSEMLIEDFEGEDSNLICELEKIQVGGYELLSNIKKILEPNSINSQQLFANLTHVLETVEIELSPSISKILINCEKLLEKNENSEIGEDIDRIKQAGINLQNLFLNKTILLNLPEEYTEEILLNKDLKPQNSLKTVNNVNLNDQLSDQSTILVVDDNASNRDLLSRQLRKENYTVATANSGKEALKMVETGEFDLILLDLLMPELSGYEVLQQLKNNSNWTHIPVIMISALDEIDSIVHCIEIGAEDYLPKPFNPILLKARIGACLEKKRLADQERKYLQTVEAFSHKMNQDLEIGRTMQQNFLPDHLLQISGWEFASFFKPARQVAGDFYDLFQLSNHNIVFVIADVCDKGVGAALFMALFRSLIRIFANDDKLIDNPDDFLTNNIPFNKEWFGDRQTNINHLKVLQSIILTNNYVANNHGDLGMFATIFMGVLEPSTGLLTYINGGHESLFIVNAQGDIINKLESTGPAVGMLPDLNFQIGQIYLQAGEILLGYTDGVTEARSMDKAFFTGKRLESLISVPNSSAVKMIDSVSKTLVEYIGDADQFDDITMLAIHRL